MLPWVLLALAKERLRWLALRNWEKDEVESIVFLRVPRALVGNRNCVYETVFPSAPSSTPSRPMISFRHTPVEWHWRPPSNFMSPTWVQSRYGSTENMLQKDLLLLIRTILPFLVSCCLMFLIKWTFLKFFGLGDPERVRHLRSGAFSSMSSKVSREDRWEISRRLQKRNTKHHHRLGCITKYSELLLSKAYKPQLTIQATHLGNNQDPFLFLLTY